MVLQESGEMYLETILILSQKGQSVRSIDVAEQMGFSKPSVSRAVSRLKQGCKIEHAISAESFSALKNYLSGLSLGEHTE